jgi:tetratricopeptide (TPR) repeat protein
MEQALFWRSQNRPDEAAASLQRWLELEPNNPDALAMQAQIQAERGDVAGAQASLRRLRAIRPNNPIIPFVEQTLRAGPIDQTELTEARRLSQQGHKTEALALYRHLFNGDIPPPEFAVEYYMLLSGIDAAGWQKARAAIAAMVAASPQDLGLQLTYAKLLTYREATRAEGIDRLQQLARQPGVASSARAAWHDALLWQAPDAQTRDQIDAYLHDNPTDSALDAKREEVLASLPDEGALGRMRGWIALDAHDIATAEREFEAALALHPDDADAMITLAVIRRRQHRIADADHLIDQAFAIAPDRREDFLAILGGYAQSYIKTNQGGGNAANNRAVSNQYAQVRRLADQSRYDEAERLLRRLMGSHPAAGDYVGLGGIQARAGHLAEAEDSFRRARQMNPHSADAAAGLAGVLAQQGHDQEADALYAEAQELYTKAGNRAGSQALNSARASQLSRQAENLEDPVAQIKMYRDAVAIEPGNPWTRLALARVLQKQGQTSEAQQAMAEVTAGDHPTVDAIQAGIIFAQGADDLPQAARLIDRLPPRARTPQMLEVQDRLAIHEDVRRISQNRSRAAVRSQLLALAAHPDPTGIRGAEIGHALVRMDDNASVRQAVNAALASTASPTAQQRLAYCGALLEAGQSQDAKAMIASLDTKSLTTQQRASLGQMMNGIAVQQADKLNQQGHPADAYDVLAPRLEEDPQNANLSMALSRLYQANGKAKEALAVDEELLERDPNNLDVRRAAAYAAIAAGDLHRADQLAAEGLQLFPKDPRAYMMSADVAKAHGNSGRALRDLQTARELRLQQLRGEQ